MGYDASLVLDNAREVIAKSVGAEPKEIYFTSGGTEANNLAVMGTVNAKREMAIKLSQQLLNTHQFWKQ